ncbi:MerR family transcriptional regulator [Brevibacillus sp. Leaf182]|uniref:MerR family transcriptional regulator n=1 Tax=Brevibacillus sp. Leaf182 TaxID=1736290 RepID=UPI0006F73AAA|nr:MerR family transcriptional regulator [Brevibacillus sp. Leaf182]RAT94801.1 methyltransferase domain-containing protein [Brevibacillus sp. Leaf182]
MQIKDMAHRLQITPRAIRYYEEKGLIKPSKADASGYRQFTEEDVWRLQTIITLREVGMAVEDIRELLIQMKDQEGSLLHYLELQRSFMYTRWVEMSKVIQTTEAMIERIKGREAIDPGELFTLAEANKRLKQTRDNWVDRWNFNEWADRYDEWAHGGNGHESYERVLDEVVATVAVKPGECGLDAGTGTGNLAGRLVKKGARMSGFDQSPQMLKQCRAKHPEVETKLGTFFAFPFLENRFDFVATSYALHHLTDDQKQLALAECRRVLKPGGRLIIADLMFKDQAHRQAHLDTLEETGQTRVIADIQDRCYADRSRLLQELANLGFTNEVRQLGTYTHLILSTCK